MASVSSLAAAFFSDLAAFSLIVISTFTTDSSSEILSLLLLEKVEM